MALIITLYSSFMGHFFAPKTRWFTIIDRKRTLDFVKSFLAMYEQGGLLPIWPLGSAETYCMIGNHSIPVIVDAYAKGIRGFDAAPGGPDRNEGSS